MKHGDVIKVEGHNALVTSVSGEICEAVYVDEHGCLKRVKEKVSDHEIEEEELEDDRDETGGDSKGETPGDGDIGGGDSEGSGHLP